MRTPQEIERGEEGPKDNGYYISFSFGQIRTAFRWLLSLFFLVGLAQAQVSYCGVDVAKDLVPTGGVAKQTLSNLLIYTNQIDNAAWSKVRATHSTNSTVAPDGTTTAETIIEDATASNSHYISQSLTGLTSGVAHRVSFYAKAKERSWVAFYADYGAPAGYTYFNVGNGAVGTISSGVFSASIRAVGNGWYRCSLTFNSNATSGIHYIYLASGDGGVSYSGDNASGLYIWGAQLNLNSDPADYIQSVATAKTLGPLCPVGYTQSLTAPSRCFIVGPVAQRTIRTW